MSISEKEVVLTNLDLYAILPKITNKSYQIMRYQELPNRKMKEINIILYCIPGFTGHWVFLYLGNKKAAEGREQRSIYFFDPYGRMPDTQWKYLRGYDENPVKYYDLTNLIKRYIHKGYEYSYNPYNIQGEFIASCHTEACDIISENECGHIVAYRILHLNLSDEDFYIRCMEKGPIKIFKTIKMLEKAQNE
jgi:hypothetical protein